MNLDEKVKQLTTEGYEFKLGQYLTDGYEYFKAPSWYFLLDFLCFPSLWLLSHHLYHW
jgi:hypothetical protein